MAYATNELYSTNDVGDRSYGVEVKTIQPKTFAASVVSPTYPVLTPVAFNTATNFWTAWVSGGANGTGTILGFVWPDETVMDAADEVLANVLIEGKILYSDIEAAVLSRGVETAANLKTSLRSGPRTQGLIIQGLDMVR